MSFSAIRNIEFSKPLSCASGGANPAFEIRFSADGEIPFPQVILRSQGREYILKGDAVREVSRDAAGVTYGASMPAGEFVAGTLSAQIEGCKRSDIENSTGEDWVKVFAEIPLSPAPEVPAATAPAPATAPQGVSEGQAAPKIEVSPAPVRASGGKPIIYFGIHKHMHQPYYNTTDTGYWDGEKDEIFGSRSGPYTHFVPTAVRQYHAGGLPHGALSTSWSGSLIEQLNRCEAEGFCGGCFGNWKQGLREAAQLKTACGNPRLDFSAFGFFHPLMALVPERDIVRQIEMHREIISSAFGVEASPVLFPPETAFHVRMIPALVKAGIQAVIYDSIHRFRACKKYPYAGTGEGMLPPNKAEKENPKVDDWMQLHNIWAGSLISPSLLRPEYVKYADPAGIEHKIIAIPAERYIGNEDARGGFGALQYPDVLGQVYDNLVRNNNFDPAHPPFFLLHSDGDNYGGGAESYYAHNTAALVDWIRNDERFELASARDYLQMFPPDPDTAVHIEPGSWSGADNGDPQFRKWFSRYEDDYSPDLNSWAVLTALQNSVHSLQDAGCNSAGLAEAERLMLCAETSCYWYWTGQDVWDAQVTNAANKAYSIIRGELDGLVNSGNDKTGPTIFAPWVTPENPGKKKWGNGRLEDAPREALVHTFIYDISGIKRVELHLSGMCGDETLVMDCRGLYPSSTSAAVTSAFFTVDLPVGAGDIRYYIEAEDDKGNVSRSALERVFLA